MKIPRWVRKKTTAYFAKSLLLPLLVGGLYAAGLDRELIEMIVDGLVGIALVYFPSQGLADFAEYWRANRDDILDARDAPE